MNKNLFTARLDRLGAINLLTERVQVHYFNRIH